MGSCFSSERKNLLTDSETLNPIKLRGKEKCYLTLIYWDLANRSRSKILSQHNFCLFFQLTGLWGDKLFKYFDTGAHHGISLEEFLNGITKIVRAPLKQKTKILFRFIKNPEDEGISYKQFLKMLYHYSKPELKQIMTNDGVFVHEAIIPSYQQLRKQKQNVIEIKHEPSLKQMGLQSQKNQFQKAFQKIYNQYQDPGTLIQFKTQQKTYHVSYCNMGTLTKQYTTHVFQKYEIDQRVGFMTEPQFQNYVNGNMKLFDTYYAVFHEKLWGFYDGKPMFLQYVEKQSKIIFHSKGKRLSAYIMLALNTLIISQSENNREDVLKMIYLSQIVVNEYGNKMLIKSEQEQNSVEIEFEVNSEVKSWMDELKLYTNNYLKSKYQVLEEIGTGRFSVVYRVKNRQSSRQYALKTLKIENMSNRQIAAIQQQLPQKRNQAEILKILKSSNFIKQYETIQTKQVIYIVSQYVYGEDLFQYVKKKGRLSESESAFLLGLIIQAIIDLHNIEIIHRDLKPENIMISYQKMENTYGEFLNPTRLTNPKPQMIKIIDFGFANLLSVLQQKKEQTPVGTLGYIAPEILLGEKPSFHNDTFAIGCIMYFMLRGKYPFASTSSEGMIILTLNGQYTLYDQIWECISHEAKDLIQQLLKTDPSERISLKQALNHSWFYSQHSPKDN